MAFTYVQLKIGAGYRLATGAVAGTSLRVTPLSEMTNGPTIIDASVSVPLDADGLARRTVAATTDPTTTTPTGTANGAYRIEILVGSRVLHTLLAQVPHDAGSVVDLTELIPVAGTPELPAPIVSSSGIHTINSEGPDGAGNVVLSPSDIGAQPADAALDRLAGLYAVIDPSLADGGGSSDADRTTAFATAYATGRTVFVPKGTYTVTALASTTTSQTIGCGEKSTIRYAGTGTMCTLTSLQRVRFVDLKFTVTDAAGILFSLSGTFDSSFTRCVFQGSHTTAGDSYSGTSGHIGVVLTGNAGDNRFYDCSFLNLAVGIKTDAIENGVLGGKFGTCNRGIYATGGGGMSLQGYIDFVSAAGATPPMTCAIDIDGATGQWWLDQVWIEGATTGIKVGTGTSGPSQFTLTGGKIAAVTTCIAVNACRNPVILGVQLAGDVGNSLTPDPITVDATNAPEGLLVADSLVPGKAISLSSLPLGWGGHTRASGTSSQKLPNETLIGYGGKLRMARSDGAYTDTMQVTGGPLLLLRGPGSAGTILRILDTASLPILECDTSLTQVNYVGLVPGATGTGPAIVARGTDTNVDLLLTPKGTGAVAPSGPLVLPSYAAGSRPATARAGALIRNSSTGAPEMGDGTSWNALGAAATGAAPKTGNYFYPIGSGATSTATLPQATAYAVPWELPAAVTLTRLGVDVSVVGDTGSKIRLGIYADSGWYPGALVLDAGQLLGDSATVQELTISQALAAGTYWLVAVGQSITTTPPTVRVASGFTPRLPLAVGSTLPSANSLSSSYVQSSVTAALPSTWTTTVTTNSRAPRLIVKAA